MPTHEDKIRATRAAQLLEDPVLLEALQGMRDDLDAQMLAPLALDPDQALRIVHARQAVHAFETTLRAYVKHGADPEPARRGFA